MNKNLINRKDRKDAVSVGSMMPYVTLSSNLLKGSWPLPAWAWAYENAESKPNLSKDQRVNLRVIQEFQNYNEKFFRKQRKRLAPSRISQIASAHSFPCFAIGLSEIANLHKSIPLLITIRSDETSSLDVIDHGVSWRVV